jgi:hypothetical protein
MVLRAPVEDDKWVGWSVHGLNGSGELVEIVVQESREF